MPQFATKAIHAAEDLAQVPDVFPPISVSTTFRYSDNPDDLVKMADIKDYDYDTVVYSREGTANTNRVEKTIEAIVGGHAVVYNSGISAVFATLAAFNPKVIAFNDGYHGSGKSIELYARIGNFKKVGIDDYDQLNEGDLLILETPRNPSGTVYDIQFYADKAHERGALIAVDSTFAPPPLQDAFKHGADIIIHSATKYFGGHSDLLAGLVVVKTKELKDRLRDDRIYLGTNIASLEASLLIRSLRTLDLRVPRQSQNAQKLVDYLVANKDKLPHLKSIQHGSLQTEEFVKKQMPNGPAPVFTIRVSLEEFAKALPSKLKYFIHATSLGGVESLIEWRALSDEHVPADLLRVSVGVENIDDLIEDLASALK